MKKNKEISILLCSDIENTLLSEKKKIIYTGIHNKLISCKKEYILVFSEVNNGRIKTKTKEQRSKFNPYTKTIPYTLSYTNIHIHITT